MAQKVHVGIVLDRSGSRAHTDAIGAVNSYLWQVKDDKDMEPSISLITSTSQSIEVIRDKVPAGSCAELAARNISRAPRPRCSTPLDTAWRCSKSARSRASAAILAVMTDGLENASREYTKETIKALLDRKQKEEGWLVLYLGTGHDAWAQGSAMGLRVGNVAAFDKQAVGVSMAAIGARSKRYAMAADAATSCIGRLHRWGARRQAPNTKALTGEMRADPPPGPPTSASRI